MNSQSLADDNLEEHRVSMILSIFFSLSRSAFSVCWASSNQFLTTLTASSRYSLLTFLTFTSTAASAGWSCYAWCSIRSILDEGLLMGIGCWALLWKWTSEKRLIRNWILVWKKKNVSFCLVIILKLNSIFTNSLFKVINIFTTFLLPLI